MLFRWYSRNFSQKKEQDFSLVEGIAKSGEAILSKDFAGRYDKVKEGLAKSKSVLMHEPVTRFVGGIQYKWI